MTTVPNLSATASLAFLTDQDIEADLQAVLDNLNNLEIYQAELDAFSSRQSAAALAMDSDPTTFLSNKIVWGDAADGVTLTGSFTGISSISEIEAILDGTSQQAASITSLSIMDGGTEIARAAFTATGISLSSGNATFALTGNFPTNLATLVELTDTLSAIGDIANMSQATLDPIINDLTGYGVTKLSISQGSETLVAFQTASNAISLSIGDYKLSLNGSYSVADFGSLLQTAFDLTSASTFSDMAHVANIGSLTLTGPGGVEYIRLGVNNVTATTDLNELSFSGMTVDGSNNAEDIVIYGPYFESKSALDTAKVTYTLKGGDDRVALDLTEDGFSVFSSSFDETNGVVNRYVRSDALPLERVQFHVDGGAGVDTFGWREWYTQDYTTATGSGTRTYYNTVELIKLDTAAGTLKGYVYDDTDTEYQVYNHTFTGFEKYEIYVDYQTVDILGASGDETFALTAPIYGMLVLDGAAGSDTLDVSNVMLPITGALVTDDLLDYTYERGADGWISLFDGDGYEVLQYKNIEYFKFADQTIRAVDVPTLLDGGQILNPVFTGTAASDALDIAGVEDFQVSALGGADVIRLVEPRSGTIDGGSGIDELLLQMDATDQSVVVTMTSATAGSITFQGADGFAKTVTFTGIETVALGSDGEGNHNLSEITYIGSSQNDTFTVDAGGNLYVDGGAGTDTLAIHRSNLQHGVGDMTFDGFVENFDIVQNADDPAAYDVVDRTYGYVGATIKNVEKIRFKDQTVTVAAVMAALDSYVVPMTGTELDDTLVGTDGNDLINGLAGNDVIYDHLGDDELNGGDGNDTFMSGSGNDTFNGGDGIDAVYISATSENPIAVDVNLDRTAGYIRPVDYPDFGDTLISIEELWYEGNFDLNVIGSDLDDFILTGDGTDTIAGNAGDDFIVAGSGVDNVDGGADEDTFAVRVVSDTPTEEVTVTYDAATGKYKVDYVDGTAYLTNVEKLHFYQWIDNEPVKVEEIAVKAFMDGFSNGDDVEVELADGDEKHLGDGNNSATVTTGTAKVEAGSGADEVTIGNDDDTDDAPDAEVDVGDGDNVVVVKEGTATVKAGSGKDTVTVGQAGSNVQATVDVGDGDNVVQVNAGKATVKAGSGKDNVTVDASSDAELDADVGDGDDQVVAAAGNDKIKTGAGNDDVSGGAGKDEIINAAGDDTIKGGEGGDKVVAFVGKNTVEEDDTDTPDTDTLVDDVIMTGIGSDVIFAGGGNDVVIGDLIGLGYYGDDTITGGTGDDLLMGSRGEDVFIFRANDGDDIIGVIDPKTMFDAVNIVDVSVTGADFVSGVDKVNLSSFGLADFTAAEAAGWSLADNADGHAVLDTTAGSITFYGLAAADINTTDDFIFV